MIRRTSSLPRLKWNDVLLDSSFLIGLRDNARVDAFLRLAVQPERRFLIPQRAFLEYVDGQPEGRRLRCARLVRIVEARPDIKFVPPEHDVWLNEMNHQLISMPVFERPDLSALHYFIRHPDDPAFESNLAAMSKAKARFGNMHVERRSDLSRKFKRQGFDLSNQIESFEAILKQGHVKVGWILSEMCAAILQKQIQADIFDSDPMRHPSLWSWGVLSWMSMFANALMGSGLQPPKRYRLHENDQYDNLITSLAAYARCFVSADEGARDRCKLLNRAGLLRCSVRSPDEFLAELRT